MKQNKFIANSKPIIAQSMYVCMYVQWVHGGKKGRDTQY